MAKESFYEQRAYRLTIRPLLIIDVVTVYPKRWGVGREPSYEIGEKLKAICGTALSKRRSADGYFGGCPLRMGERYYTLISTSTPLGNSSFIRASTVFDVEL